MEISQNYEPEFDSLQDLMLHMGRKCSAEEIPHLVAKTFAARPHVGLVRIWTVQPGKDCNACHRKHLCRETSCLHMVASVTKHKENTAWNCTTGADSRIPIGFSEIGSVALTGVGIRIHNFDENQKKLFQDIQDTTPEIVGVGIQPLALKNDILGIIAVYALIDLKRVRRGDRWLGNVAGFVAFALSNARAFEEIESLRAQLELENEYLRNEIHHIQSPGGIIGKSPPVISMLDQIAQVAPTEASVLILGESGTGKELVAREIHKRSLRGKKPMISVNCASIPGELYESEFFGHKKGAFTGAISDRGGRFQAADGGTLFLDEVGEIPLLIQGKLLRVLQEGMYERIGEEKTRKVDVRIIAATNRNIEQEIAAGNFRQDLYYRLNVFPIEVVPLRKRKKDIPILARHFLKSVSKKMNHAVPQLTDSNIRELMDYEWPGNVRELQNIIERAVITSRSGRFFFHLPVASTQVESSKELSKEPAENPWDTTKETVIFTEQQIRAKTRKNMIAALKKCKGTIYGDHGAAMLLGISPTTLSSRISRLKITKQEIFNEKKISADIDPE
ncbi:sigma-54 interaction domain-containing protein [Desulfobacula phenolica]|nr:sigma 54-interacting transcriptional regulator [Desulfobacula phenolica]